MDYISDCESTGDPTILAINIATSFKNAAAGSNISLAITWTPPYLPDSRIEREDESWFSSLRSLFRGKESEGVLPYSAANLPRYSLLGSLEPIPKSKVQAQGIAECFVEKHKDAKYWLPGNRIHESEWVRLVVREVYWIGGFGDREYIGWIPVEEWRSVASEEWESARLPGERKGWKEWSVEGQWEL